MDDSDSDVDEETVARERAALQAAMGAAMGAGPQPQPPTLPTRSLGVEARVQVGAVAERSLVSRSDDDDDDGDESDDEETVARERAALQAAMGTASPALGRLALGGPSALPTTSAPNPNLLGALALQKALMANLAYQRLCRDELAAIDRALRHQQPADASAGPEPQNAAEALFAMPGPRLGSALGPGLRSAWHPRQPRMHLSTSYRPEGEPFFLEEGDELGGELEVSELVGARLRVTPTPTRTPAPTPT